MSVQFGKIGSSVDVANSPIVPFSPPSTVKPMTAKLPVNSSHTVLTSIERIKRYETLLNNFNSNAGQKT